MFAHRNMRSALAELGRKPLFTAKYRERAPNVTNWAPAIAKQQATSSVFRSSTMLASFSGPNKSANARMSPLLAAESRAPDTTIVDYTSAGI